MASRSRSTWLDETSNRRAAVPVARHGSQTPCTRSFRNSTSPGGGGAEQRLVTRRKTREAGSPRRLTSGHAVPPASGNQTVAAAPSSNVGQALITRESGWPTSIPRPCETRDLFGYLGSHFYRFCLHGYRSPGA